MRLYSGKVGAISSEVVRTLIASKEIESESPREVESDVESVLKNYLTMEKEVTDRTKDLLERTGRDMSEFNRVRSQLAEQKGIKVGDEALDYLLDQVVEIFHHSSNVDEIYCSDVDLRRKMAPVFKKHMAVDANLEAEVREQLKHVREGTPAWDIEHARVMDQIKRKKGL